MHRHPVAALVLACVLLFIVVFVPLPATTLGLRVLHDFAHAPIFGCVALLFLYVMRSYPRPDALGAGRQYLFAAMGAVFFGALTELAQIPVGRDSSWFDVRSDLLGATAFLALFSAVDTHIRGRRPGMRAAAVVVGIGLFIFHSLPAAYAALAYERRADAFPVLADFTQRMDGFFVMPQRARIDPVRMPAEWMASPGERTLQVRFGSPLFPGLDFYEPAPDWRGYATLALDVTNPTDLPLTLTLRVHDVHHTHNFTDRFNRAFDLAPRTRQVLRIPIAEVASAPHTRSMDMQHIAGVMLFRTGDSVAPQMDVSKLWLE
jgi:hypothetical protein